MPNLVSPQPGQITMTGSAAGVVTCSQDQATITGIVNKGEKILLEREDPPLRYAGGKDPHWTIFFWDDGTYWSIRNGVSGSGNWSQP